MNKVIISGRFTKEHELRYTQSGTAVLSNTIASNRKFKNQNGEYETDFINVILFNNQAKFASDYTKKGDMVLIEGRMQTRNYEGQDGKRVYVTEVVADSIESLTPKQSNNNQISNTNENKPKQEEDPFMTMHNQIDIDDNMDLPF